MPRPNSATSGACHGLLVHSTLAALWPAVLLGMTGSPQRRRSLWTAQVLLDGGIAPEGVLAFLIASHALVIYFLAVLTLLLVVEFAFGQALGGLLMILLVVTMLAAGVLVRSEARPQAISAETTGSWKCSRFPPSSTTPCSGT